MRTKKEITVILRTLEKLFPEAKCPLHYRKPWQLIVAVILSAQCTDKKVNEVTPALFAKYPTLELLSNAKLRDVEKLIFQTGFYHAKAKHIVSMARTLLRNHHGKVPQTMAELTQLPGVGRKTANVVQGELYGTAEGIAVDAHVIRLARLLGLTGSSNPIQIERDLMQQIPASDWVTFPHRIMSYGRAYCTARAHDHLACPLRKLYRPTSI